MPIPLKALARGGYAATRPDFDAAQLRRIARESEDAKQVRRAFLALVAIYDGAIRNTIG